jgi:hypothetical protein
MLGIRTPYPHEFTVEAVKLVTERGLPRIQVARDLGLDVGTLRRWCPTRCAYGANNPSKVFHSCAVRQESSCSIPPNISRRWVRFPQVAV